MRACVVGAGSIGSLLAAHLATVADVLVLTRRHEHARALNAEGLRVSGRHDFTARVTAAADPRELPDFELGIIATKAWGKMIRRNIWPWLMLRAVDASHWPRGTDWMAPRTTSAP